jgi:hypothetical protein
LPLKLFIEEIDLPLSNIFDLCEIFNIFGREPSNEYFIKILFLLSKWFQTRRFLWKFPIGSKKGGWNFKKIFSSETTQPISTKLC